MNFEDEDFKSLNPKKLNKLLAKTDEKFSPKEVMRLYYPAEVRNAEGNQKIEIFEQTLENGNTLVSLVHDNLLDDSLKAEKYVMELKNSKGKWIVLVVKKNWKCRRGRGHSDWGIALCK